MGTAAILLALALMVFVLFGMLRVVVRKGHRKWWAKTTGLALVATVIMTGLGGFLASREKAKLAGFESQIEHDFATKLGMDKVEYDAHKEAVKRQAEAAAIEAKKRAEEEAARKDAECRQNLRCWAEKNFASASTVCSRLIPRLAKFDSQWTDGMLEPKFSHFRWADQKKGHVTYIGDKIMECTLAVRHRNQGQVAISGG